MCVTALLACERPSESKGANTGEGAAEAEPVATEREACTILLERAGMPFGYDYRVVLGCDGAVAWDGNEGVAHIGVASARADPARVRFLWEHLSSLPAFVDPAYLAKIEGWQGGCYDMPPGQLRVQLDGEGGRRETSLRSCNPGGDEIRALHEWTREIDEVAGTAIWVFGAADVRDHAWHERPSAAVEAYPEE